MAKQTYQYTKRRHRRKYALHPAQFNPNIWIDGPGMYADCPHLKGLEFSEKQESDWSIRLAKILRDEWNINASNLTLEWQEEHRRYKLNFNDDEEFIMVKLIHG